MEHLFDGDIVEQTNQLLWTAITEKISDVHIEPHARDYRIRFRRDGLLYEWKQLASSSAIALSARLKALSHLDVAERRLPQDGHFFWDGFEQTSSRNATPVFKIASSEKEKVQVGPFQIVVNTVPETYDFRLSSCPTIYGEKIVLRLLNASSFVKSITTLGLTSSQEEIFLKVLAQPQGLILFIGPTGSGKTVSLYTALQFLEPKFKNILTVEDPVEINMPGVNQVNINVKSGLTFAAALRAFLRQDPDVIMVGEIRDDETAHMVIKAVQTGHLILSTLHAHDTVQAFDRLLNLTLTKAQIQSHLLLLIAQRLVRKLCEFCKKSLFPTKDFLTKYPHAVETNIFGPDGCQKCHVGYKGRIGIFELLPITQDVIKIFLESHYRSSLESLLHKQFLTLRAAAVQKVLEGVTSLEEVDRVIPESLDLLLSQYTCSE